MKNKTLNLTLTAAFIALILVLGLTPLGLIPLGFIHVTILCVPVVVGTILLGLKTGLVLGACFGTVSVLTAFGIVGAPSALVAPLVAASPALVVVMSYLPRLLVPVFAYLVHRLISRNENVTAKTAVPAAAIIGSLTNTVFYLGLMLLFYYITGINSAAVLKLIGGTGLIAGISEAVVAALLCTPIVVALRKVCRKK